jgi:hypothetical protein
LHGRAARLHLPAGEVGPVIREDQFEIAHMLFRVFCRVSIINNCYFEDWCAAERAATRQLYYCTYDQWKSFAPELQGTLAARST